MFDMHSVASSPAIVAAVTQDTKVQVCVNQLVSHTFATGRSQQVEPLLVPDVSAAATHHEVLLQVARCNGLHLGLTAAGGDCFYDAVRQGAVEHGLVSTV